MEPRERRVTFATTEAPRRATPPGVSQITELPSPTHGDKINNFNSNGGGYSVKAALKRGRTHMRFSYTLGAVSFAGTFLALSILRLVAPFSSSILWGSSLASAVIWWLYSGAVFGGLAAARPQASTPLEALRCLLSSRTPTVTLLAVVTMLITGGVFLGLGPVIAGSMFSVNRERALASSELYSQLSKVATARSRNLKGFGSWLGQFSVSPSGAISALPQDVYALLVVFLCAVGAWQFAKRSPNLVKTPRVKGPARYATKRSIITAAKVAGNLGGSMVGVWALMGSVARALPLSGSFPDRILGLFPNAAAAAAVMSGISAVPNLTTTANAVSQMTSLSPDVALALLGSDPRILIPQVVAASSVSPVGWLASAALIFTLVWCVVFPTVFAMTLSQELWASPISISLEMEAPGTVVSLLTSTAGDPLHTLWVLSAVEQASSSRSSRIPLFFSEGEGQDWVALLEVCRWRISALAADILYYRSKGNLPPHPLSAPVPRGSSPMVSDPIAAVRSALHTNSSLMDISKGSVRNNRGGIGSNDSTVLMGSSSYMTASTPAASILMNTLMGGNRSYVAGGMVSGGSIPERGRGIPLPQDMNPYIRNAGGSSCDEGPVVEGSRSRSSMGGFPGAVDPRAQRRKPWFVRRVEGLKRRLVASRKRTLTALAMLPGMREVCGRNPALEGESLFASANLVTHMLVVITNLVVASAAEDQFGVVQHRIPDILEVFLELLTQLEMLMQESNHRLSKKEAVGLCRDIEMSICPIVDTFYSFMPSLRLDTHLRDRLQRFMDSSA